MSGFVVSPYDRQRYIGSVCLVRPAVAEVNLPLATRPGSAHVAGYSMQRGQVGEFVIIEGEEHAILGRMIETRLPERDRLSVETMRERNEPATPVGVVQLLTSVDLATGVPLCGILAPRIGQHIFSPHPIIVKQIVEWNMTPARFLPTLGQGVAMVVGVGAPCYFQCQCADPRRRRRLGLRISKDVGVWKSADKTTGPALLMRAGLAVNAKSGPSLWMRSPRLEGRTSK